MKNNGQAQGSIVVKERGNRRYYYYARSYRVKIDPNATGKTKGSGKSRVVSEQTYLGTAEDVLETIRRATEIQEPSEVQSKAFGLPMALFDMAERIGLRDVVNQTVSGSVNGISIGDFVLIAAINRVGNHDSKESIGRWYDKTDLGKFQKVDSQKLNSKSFWYAFDKIVSEKPIKEEKAARGYAPNEKIDIDELEAILDDSSIEAIEKGIWKNLSERFGFVLDAVLYDTTNFYNHHDLDTPNTLGQFGKSKENQFDKRLIGLQLAMAKDLGIPVFHNVYCGNHHDASLFPTAVRTLVRRYHEVNTQSENLILVFDKGNNSQKNLTALKNEGLSIDFVGTLTPSHHPDLLRIPLDDYEQGSDGSRVYRTQKRVFGDVKTIVITYNEALARRKEHAFEKKMKRFMKEAKAYFESIYTEPTDQVEAQMRTFFKVNKIGTSQAQRFYSFRVWHNGWRNMFQVRRKPSKVRLKKDSFGKNLIFTNLHEKTSEAIIGYQKNGYQIEDGFHHLKDRDLASYYPAYHWTDSKIRVHAFVCVMALLLLKMLGFAAKENGVEMSSEMLIEELQDIRIVILVYPNHKAIRKVSHLSRVQTRLYEAFGLDKYT